MSIDKKTIQRVFLGVAGCILLYWFLHETDRVKRILQGVTGILSPFLLGAALAFIINVPMRAMEKLLGGMKKAGARRALALVLTLLVLVLVIALVFWLLIPQLSQTIQTLIPQLRDFFVRMQARIQDYIDDDPELLKWINENTSLASLNWADLAQKVVSFVGNSLSTILGSIFSAIGSLSGAVMNVFVGVIFAIYCLFDKEKLGRQFRRVGYAILPEGICDELIRILQLTNKTFSDFLSGQCLEVCILGSMFAVAMTLFRMPYVALISVLIAVTAFIPIVGAWIGCIVGAFLILVTNPLQAVVFVVMFLILQQIENNMIYPKVVGTSVGLPSMWVLIAVSVGGSVMGVAGMVLMIPMVSVCYALARQYTDRLLDRKNIDPGKTGRPVPPPEQKDS